MTEIEKMFENAGVSKIIPKMCSNNELDCIGCLAYTKNAIPYCKNAEYPDFTAEKQIELVKTIEKDDSVDCVQIVYNHMENLWKITIIPVCEMSFEEIYLYFGCDKDFSTALAMAINNLWQSLIEQEKEEIRRILNE